MSAYMPWTASLQSRWTVPQPPSLPLDRDRRVLRIRTGGGTPWTSVVVVVVVVVVQAGSLLARLPTQSASLDGFVKAFLLAIRRRRLARYRCREAKHVHHIRVIPYMHTLLLVRCLAKLYSNEPWLSFFIPVSVPVPVSVSVFVRPYAHFFFSVVSCLSVKSSQVTYTVFPP
ncbi:hypothetical protein F4813DRAFT_168517 [Daldinia decipiens]|uniref:uncharacterized protein n=1 Tax=Daldinia decipiens TaxID=326647 RepID=UPI0020C339DA|nr:uncharacterized protein F4813DRAFT_168517 [Daldinia decipiens]KAI1661677.1 hypothetical protein F4813DRAFT_168517 [Daldinia decipiens]